MKMILVYAHLTDESFRLRRLLAIGMLKLSEYADAIAKLHTTYTGE
jgi:hypothetical protein